MFKLLHALAVSALIALPTVHVAAQPSAPVSQGDGLEAEVDAATGQLSLTEWHDSDVVSALVPGEAELQGDEEEPPADSYTVSPAYGETLATHAAIEHQVAPNAVWIAPHVSSGAPRGPPAG